MQHFHSSAHQSNTHSHDSVVQFSCSGSFIYQTDRENKKSWEEDNSNSLSLLLTAHKPKKNNYLSDLLRSCRSRVQVFHSRSLWLQCGNEAKHTSAVLIVLNITAHDEEEICRSSIINPYTTYMVKHLIHFFYIGEL